ncbi:MAG: hypothetical protein LBT41_01635 [Candidatus Methanoplasma sp.]|jgi:hypothetical protein|nr:hypothetical protein [Candidatus Methanoplasma sp.]
MVSEIDKLQMKLMVPVAAVVIAGYFIDNENGVFLAGAVLAVFFMGMAIYFSLDAILPARKPTAAPTDGDCEVVIECSEYCVNLKPLFVVVNGNETAKIYRGSQITLHLTAGDAIEIRNKTEQTHIMHCEDGGMKLYVWIEPLADEGIHAERFYGEAPPKDKAYKVYKMTNRIGWMFTIPVLLLGSVAMCVMLWRAGVL